MNRTKRSRRRESPPYSSRDHDRRTSQKPDHLSEPNPNRRINQQPPTTSKLPVFDSYIDTPNLPSKVKLLCEIVAHTPPIDVTRVLDDTEIRVSTEVVEDVLKLSYAHPGAVVKFFRWSGYQLNDKHSPYAWNLIVDMLGKNCMFDAMWDAIKSMKKECLLSLATFASVFGSYVMADKVQEAIMTFQVMDQYGCKRDIIALNSLLSAICRDGKTIDAKEFLNVARAQIRPDADTYAILLEGWETEQDVVNARKTFDEMVVAIGWDPNNFPAYDSLLNTLLKGPDGLREAMKSFESLKNRRCYPGMRFFKAALSECAKKCDAKFAEILWDSMGGCKPDTEMYNLMISLYSNRRNVELARRWLDDMVYNGVFPNSESYNIFFKFLTKTRILNEAESVFSEMIKNEFVPNHANCCLAVKMFLDGRDPYMAIKVWKCMIENYKQLEVEETGNILVSGLLNRDLNCVPEAVKYAEDMIDRGVKLSSATLSRLKQSLLKAGKGPVYDGLLKKWKLHNVAS